MLDVKGQGSIASPAERKVALSSARLPAPAPQPLALTFEQMLAFIRIVSAPGARLDPAQADGLQAWAKDISATGINGWAAALVEAAGGPFMLADTVELLLEGVTQVRPMTELAIALVDAFGAQAMPADRLVQILRPALRLARDPRQGMNTASLLVRRLTEHLGGVQMPAALRDAMLDLVTGDPDDPLGYAVEGFVDALRDLAPGADLVAAPRLHADARPHLKALFERVMLRPSLHPEELGARVEALNYALAPWMPTLPVIEDLLDTSVEASIRAAALPRESDPFWMTPLPANPGFGILHGIVPARFRLDEQQLLRDLLTFRLHAAAPDLRPEGIWQLYTDLAGLVRATTTPTSDEPRRALVNAVVGMQGSLTLVQFHEMVHAVAGALSGGQEDEDREAVAGPGWNVAACFYDALRAAQPPMPAPAVAALVAALTDALVHHTPVASRDAMTQEHLRALVAAAAGLTQAQRSAAVMGLCSAHARRHGGREPVALKGLKSALDARRREAEGLPGAARSGTSMADAFADGLMLALEPERALQPVAWALPLAPQDAPGLLLVAFGMPVKGAKEQVAGGLSELAHRPIDPQTAQAIAMHSAQGRGLLMEPQALGALHRHLIAQVLQPDDGMDRKHVPASAAGVNDLTLVSLRRLLDFYDGLDLAAGVGEPDGQRLAPNTRQRFEHGLALFTQCMSDIRKLIQPTDPATARGLLSRLSTAARNLADRLEIPYEVPAELTPGALLRRLQSAGGSPVPPKPLPAPPTAGRGDRKSEGGTLRQALLGLPDDVAKARKALAPFAMQFASTIEPVTRRSVTGDITASVADLSQAALTLVASEIAVAMGGDQLDALAVGPLHQELLSPPAVSAAAAHAITQGLALGLGGREIPDRLLRALMAAALATGPQALTTAKQEAVVHALAQVLGQRGHLALIERVTGSGLPAADCQRLRAAIAATQRSVSTTPPAKPSSSNT